MRDRIPIDLQIAKNELARINDSLPGPRLLIGGLAVQRYIATRASKDIDLVCDYQEARELVRSLYPAHDWEIREVNDDAYRPSFHVRHMYKNTGDIIFGPKITEREPYKFIDWQFLLENGVPYILQARSLNKVLIPSCPHLAYTKLISFLGRSTEKHSGRCQGRCRFFMRHFV